MGLPKGLVVRCSQTFSQVTKINGTICEKQSAGRSKDIFLDDVNKFIFGMAKRKSEAKHEETFLAKGDCNKGGFVSGAGSTQQNARWSRMAGRGREEDISNSLLSNRLFSLCGFIRNSPTSVSRAFVNQRLRNCLAKSDRKVFGSLKKIFFPSLLPTPVYSNFLPPPPCSFHLWTGSEKGTPLPSALA